jgi:hypothetical protein
LAQSANDWQSSYFAIHNWWHQSLFHLERGEIEQVLGLYDGPIRGSRSSEWLDLVDAASLLWRLSLFGIDVEKRATELSGDIEPLLGEPVYLFNDWHAVMALSLAGCRDEVERVTTAVRRHSLGSNRVVAERVGLVLLEGFDFHASGRFDDAVEVLSEARPFARAIGGSHAQRDVIDLTLIAAAARSGRVDYADALVKERLQRKPAAASAMGHLLSASTT